MCATSPDLSLASRCGERFLVQAALLTDLKTRFRPKPGTAIPRYFVTKTTKFYTSQDIYGKHLMKNRLAVPVAQFRTGSVVEFEVVPGKPKQGTVKYLVAYGARNMLAVLSRCVDHDGSVQDGLHPVTGMEPTINISYATRVLSHCQTGRVVFDNRHLEQHMSEAAKIRAGDGYVRRGTRVILAGDTTLPSISFSLLVLSHLALHGMTLGIKPWELLDFEALLTALKAQQGIIKATEDSVLGCTVRMEVRTDKFARFVRQNINRFKLNLNDEVRERELMDKEEYEAGDEWDNAFYDCDPLPNETPHESPCLA
jgi:hypothetical protein